MAELHLGALLMHCSLSFSADSTPCCFQIPSELWFCCEVSFENVHHSRPHQPPPPQYTDFQSRTDSYESWIITVIKVNQRRVISPAFFFLPHLKFCVFTWLHKWPFIGQGPPPLILRWCLEHWIVFCSYGGNRTGVLVLRWKLELCSKFSNKSFIKKKEKKTGKIANMLSLSHCLYSPPPQSGTLNSWLALFPRSGSKQRVWEGGVCEPGAAVLWVHPARCLLPRCLHVHAHLPGRPVCHRLHAPALASRGESGWALPEGARQEDGGTVLGRAAPRVWAALGVAVRRVTCRWEGDGFPVVASCFKAHLSLLLTDTKNLDYNLYLLEFSFGYAEIEKIW